MSISFSKYVAIYEIFGLHSKNEVSAIKQSPEEEAKNRIEMARREYSPGPHGDDLAAAVIGLKPAAIVKYFHHPENPASGIFSGSESLKPSGHGNIQAELIKHGIRVRPDFHIIHMNLPGYSDKNIIVGGRKHVEELWKLYKCQYVMDYWDSVKDKTPDNKMQLQKVLQGQCGASCELTGTGGFRCIPLHKRIGQLLGYTDEQIDSYIKDTISNGFSHIPDLEYPELPSSLSSLPRKKGFDPNESRIRASSSPRIFG